MTTDSHREPASLSTLFGLFFGVLVAGVFYLRYCALETGLPMNVDRSIFWAINALTLTGLRIAPNGLSDFSPAGVLGVYVLMIIGAMFAMVVGGVMVCRWVGLAHGVWKLSAGAVFLLFGGTLAGAGLLLSEGRPFYAAMFEATSAISNAGLNLDGARRLYDWRLHLVILPLAAAGAIGLPVVVELFDRLVLGRPLSAYSVRVVRLFLIVWLCGFVLMLMGNSHMPWRENVVASWVMSINARSLGAEIQLDSAISRVGWWCMGMLMLLGAPPAGTGGGVRLLPAATLLRGAQWEPAGGYAFANVARAVAWVGLYGAIYLATFLLLMSAEGQLSTDRAMAISAAALGNVALPQDQLSLSSRGLVIVSTAMLAGYLLPLRFMHLIVGPGGDADLPARS